MNARIRKLFVIALVVSLAVGFTGGFVIASYGQGPLQSAVSRIINKDASKPQNVDFGLFWQVWNTLQSKYVGRTALDNQKLLYGAVSGMVNSVGDPYTTFFEPVTSKKFQEDIAGSFGGVGMEIGQRNNILTIIAPLKNTPASRAGLKAGDQILKINGNSTEGLSVEEAVNRIRGRQGTKVTLTILPSGETQSRDFTLIRDIIKVSAVDLKFLDGHIAYMTISIFNQNVDGEFEKAVQQILDSKADRLIVDLRNNPGGLMDSAVNLAGWFLDEKSLVTTEDFGTGQRSEFRTAGQAELKKYPAVILINGGSASASEILAGALHDDRGIKLIGEKSFGKGSVQELISFSDSSSLKVTIAKWLTPSGISISDKGIQADITVTIDPKDVQAGTVVLGEQGKDPQLDKAIEIVNGL